MRPGKVSGAPAALCFRFISGIALCAALLAALGIAAGDIFHIIRPDMPWRIKSAIPLIAIGSSYAALQFSIPRTAGELWLSLAVSLAFILWGAEQFIHARWITALIDDFVVVLFVSDLGFVIRGHLKRSAPR